MDEERLQQAYGDMDELYNFYVEPSISKMADDLDISVDALIKALSRKEISEDLARKMRFLRALKIGTAYVPGPKATLDKYNEIIEFGSAYVPAPKPMLDKYNDIIELGTVYVKAPQSKLDIYNNIIEYGTCYIPAPKPELEPIDSFLIDEAQSRLIDLLQNIPVDELARKLKIGHIQIKNYQENREMISPEIAQKLRFFWQIEFGTSFVPAPQSILDEPVECSIFDNIYRFIGNNKKYKISNIKDVLPRKIEDIHYDGALKRVIPDINEDLYIFFSKNLEIEETQELSSGITADCPEFRKFELEILEDDVMQYYFIYGKGKIIDSSESLHYQKIAAILRNEGSWEK